MTIYSLKLYIFLWCWSCIFGADLIDCKTSLRWTSAWLFHWNKPFYAVRQSVSLRTPSLYTHNCYMTNHSWDSGRAVACFIADGFIAPTPTPSQLKRWVFSHITGRWFVCLSYWWLWTGHTIKILSEGVHGRVGVWGDASSKFGFIVLKAMQWGEVQ